MRTRCVHNRHDMCYRCQQKAERDARDGDDRYWFKVTKNGEKDGDWVYNPDSVFSPPGMSPLNMLPTQPGTLGKPSWNAPVSNGIAVSAGGSGVVDGVRLEPTHWEAEFDKDFNVWQYKPVQAEQQSIQQMPTTMSNAEIEAYRSQLVAAVHDAAEWKRIASESLAERKAMSERHHKQLDAMERNQPTTQSQMEVAATMPETRIGNTVRERYIEHLGNMFADGCLSEEEFTKRSDAANEALFESQLRPLVADLPAMPTPLEAPKIAGRQVDLFGKPVKQHTSIATRVLNSPVASPVGLAVFSVVVLALLLLSVLL